MVTLLVLLVYVVSSIRILKVYLKKFVEPNLWSIFFLFCPLVNTILAIKLTKKTDLFTLKSFIKSLKLFFEKLELYDNRRIFS